MSGEEIIGGIVGIFMIGVILITVIPALGQATGTDTTLFSFIMVIAAIAIALGLFKG